MLIYDALVLAKTAMLLPRRASVLSLGVPKLYFTAEAFEKQIGQSPEFAGGAPVVCSFENYRGFFHALGFNRVDVLDISDYEGANIIGDLNDPELSTSISTKYDLIYDSGTIEHIFDAPTALRTLVNLTNVGGAIVHATPANGFMDHGLWQLSPDVFRTFYRAAEFSLLTSALFIVGNNQHAVRADENFYRRRGRCYIVERFPEAIAVFSAQKTTDRVSVKIGMQDFYREMHGGVRPKGISSFFIEYGSYDNKSPSEILRMQSRFVMAAKAVATRIIKLGKSIFYLLS